jgi:hypothetical protein
MLDPLRMFVLVITTVLAALLKLPPAEVVLRFTVRFASVVTAFPN